jgi:hypothetical protein
VTVNADETLAEGHEDRDLLPGNRLCQTYCRL